MYSRFVQRWVLVVFGLTMFLANVLLVGLMANIAHRAKGWGLSRTLDDMG